eukprot:CAMPEP_0194032002 /NCGR_PEP_ID=MMETSP0009_2-20130614/5047_1 /TAXON_ID=210454 /ORGANISM="Grammatophora oceanica, Strain CCMP 410" /LENGTH=620 /DNA_ID=CAMNT_0038672321 /DNA_START=63 /DNA_END=1925 /DNA_ORIENTATION=+
MKLMPNGLAVLATVGLTRGYVSTTTTRRRGPPSKLDWRTSSILASSTGPSASIAGARPFTTSLGMTSKKDAAFPTWSFDKPCTSMEWNELVSTSLSMGDSYEDADLIIVGVFAPESDKGDEEEEEENGDDKEPTVALTGKAKEIDDALSGGLTEMIEANKFKYTAGKALPTVRLANPDGKMKRYVVLGLGKPPKKGLKDLPMKVGSTVAGRCNLEKKVGSCTVILPEAFGVEEKSMKDLSSSFFATLYSDNRYRTGTKVKKLVEDLTSVSLVSEAASVDEGAASWLESGKQLAAGIFLAKDIVNAPHNVLNSLGLANTAKKIASESKGRIKCTILGKSECEKRGMGAFLGVARGSETEPQFIHLTYTPPSGSSKDLKKVGIVGKGLLFDTGGYNIKTGMMELMKFDCGGSAAVLGAARAIGAMAPEGVEAHFIVAACENMINGKAYVPSDILTASNGKTIEIGNTDAEGRLTLADALVFADKELDCEKIIELSTLTGACMVSLGKKIAGVWTDNEALAKELADISEATGDKSWRMPLAKEYDEQLASKIADMKNVGTRYGGAITAGLFLAKFVSKKKPFSHIDIAGPVWDDKKGATGFGARLVAEWVTRQGMKEEDSKDE